MVKDRPVERATDAPVWFTAALDHAPRHGRVRGAGVDIVYREWGPVDVGEELPPLLLLHGVAAHSGWWDHLGPQLADRRRVVAIDLAGHGDSGRRDSYSIDTWADDVLALVDDLGLRCPYLVGHSLGGIVSMRVAQRAGEQLCGIVVLESVIEDRGATVPGDPRSARSGTLRVHPDRKTALARWRPLPAGATVPDFTAQHVAAGSLRQVEGGWTWKFDPRVFATKGMFHDEVVPVPCRVALFRGETGSVTQTAQERVVAALGARTLDLVVPGAGHNVTLETPQAVALALSTLGAAWDQAT